MLNEKKISIKYYLNDKLKAKIHNDDEFFPLYVRVSFNRVNTQIPVLDLIGEKVLMRKVDYSFFFDKVTRIPYMSGGQIIANKDQILKQALSLHISNLGEKIKLSDFVKKYRYCEKYLLYEFDALLISQVLVFIKGKTTPQQFENLSATKVFAILFLKLKEYNLDTVVQQKFNKKIELLVALCYHTRMIWQNGDDPIEQIVRASFFAWKYKDDKALFKSYIEMYYGKDSKNYRIDGPYSLLIDDFVPNIDNMNYYMQVIDNELISQEEIEL